jgi:hypothetical protein
LSGTITNNLRARVKYMLSKIDQSHDESLVVWEGWSFFQRMLATSSYRPSPAIRLDI